MRVLSGMTRSADPSHKFEGADMDSNPIFQALTCGGFGVGVVAGAQRGNKEGGWELRTALWVEDGNRVSGVVDEELLTGLVFLTEYHVLAASPAPVEFAEAGVAVTVGMILVIFLPPQLQCQMTVTLEFLVQTSKVWDGPMAFIDAPWRRPEQNLLQPGIIPAFGQRPDDPGRLRPFQIVINRCLSDRAAAGDLVAAIALTRIGAGEPRGAFAWTTSR